jgi:hypothetical protein
MNVFGPMLAANPNFLDRQRDRLAMVGVDPPSKILAQTLHAMALPELGQGDCSKP